ncbi:DUF998 domain-containing protein [Pyrococcus sp. ST04]|uniref:DUF998 domain-containing protein n=1 Tax=Pyrococcus sp. ST04 TaxID=1183377 RepID=UPI0002605F45|nr:DUF998 domain-containing protein [Pyrococcus sp. ST04]AFK23285.1 hypothetical protein Py04_1716 [Pyrococcus sp. ST04]
MKIVKRFLPILTAIYFIIGLIIVIHKNPWFSFMRNALSDMGSLKNPNGWMFNSYIIGLGFLGLITAKVLNRKILQIAMLFLILVGVFPEEKPLHTPSAVLTYLLSFLDMALYGIKWIALGTFLVMIGLIKVGVGLAVPEIFGAVIILAYMIYLGWKQ